MNTKSTLEKLAIEHRNDAHIKEGDIWQLVDPNSAQARLFSGASGGQPELVQRALAAKANPTGILLCKWPGLEKAGDRATGPAYFWLHHNGDPARIYTPIEAAVAGGNEHCVRLILAAGGNLLAAAKWVFGLTISVRRVEAGLVVLSLMDAADFSHQVIGRDFLARARQHLLRSFPRPRVLQARTRLETVARPFDRRYQRDVVSA